jgi:2-enoate reductase
MKYKNLFSPIKIGSIEVKNRIAMMPMGVFSERLMSRKDGSYTKDGADYYIERAKGGTGLIVTGLVPMISWLGLPYIGSSPETYIKNSKYLVDGIHKYGAKIFQQLTAISGRSSVHPGDPAPSALPMVWDPTKNAREMTVEEIKNYVKGFANGAETAQKAGYDGVEIHAVHEGYLIDQFTMSSMNHREDEYGGSLENRLRFPTEIVQAIKERCGKDFPVSLRYSVKSYIKAFNRGALPGEEFKEFGRDIEESLLVAKKLEEAGYDMLNCDNGTYDSWYWSHPPVYMPKACNLEDVKRIAEVVDIPVVCAGKFDNPVLADEAIGKGEIDIMGMGRPLLADPEVANKFMNGEEEDIRQCIGCHLGCLSRIFTPPFKDISCALNPACGRERSYALEPAETKKKIAVVGGGIGGLEAARVATIRGHEVDIYEKTDKLGGAFIAAASFEFKDDDKRLLDWYGKQIKDLKINVLFNTEFTEEYKADYDEIFVATGAKERILDIPGFNGKNVSYAIEHLENPEIEGENVVIVGGGLTGFEIALSLCKKGKKVSIIEKEDVVLNVKGLNAANYNMLIELMEYYEVKVLKNTEVKKFEDGFVYAEQLVKNYPNSAGRAFNVTLPGTSTANHKIPADHVVVSVGYISDKDLYEKVKDENVHLIGDAIRPGNLMDAIWSAYELAMNI